MEPAGVSSGDGWIVLDDDGDRLVTAGAGEYTLRVVARGKPAGLGIAACLWPHAKHPGGCRPEVGTRRMQTR
jgi:hypothetical protein